MLINRNLRGGALLCLAVADQVSARPHAINAIDSVRLVGAVDVHAGEDPYVTGKRLLAADNTIAALAAFQQTLATSPGSVDALNAIGVCYDQLGRADLARSYYEAGLALDPMSPRLLNNRGYSLFMSGDRAAAIMPLRAAAASSDPEAAAAAQATLQLIVDQATPVVLAQTPAAPAVTARVELTNDGEQRLIFDSVASSSTTNEAAVLAIVAAPWTDRDDVALLAQVHAEDRAEQLAALTADVSRRAAVAAPAEASVTVEQVAILEAAPPPSETGWTSVLAGSTAGSANALVLGEMRADAALARRRTASDNRRAAAITGGDPAQRLAAVFDSDDAELNAFAARMATAATSRAERGTSPSELIKARFRA